MKLAIIGATGKVGKLVVKEAKKRNIDVSAVVRQGGKTGIPEIVKDVYALTKEDVESFDVVISALGFVGADAAYEFEKSTQHLIQIFSGLETRLILVGGAGSLYVDSTHQLQLKDTPDFPEVYKPFAEAQAVQLDTIRNAKNVHWTYLSPAADFQADGKRVGSYQVAGEEFTVNQAGQSFISYADYAIAIVEEAIVGKHKNTRFSVYQA